MAVILYSLYVCAIFVSVCIHPVGVSLDSFFLSYLLYPTIY